MKQMLSTIFAALAIVGAVTAQVPATGILSNGLRYVIQPASPPCDPSNSELLFGFADCAPREAQSAIVTIMGGDDAVSGYVVTLTYEDDGVVKQIARTVKRTAFSSSAGFETGRLATSKLPGVRIREISVGIVGKTATGRVE